MFILKKGHQPGVYVPLRALFLVQSGIAILQTFSPIRWVGGHWHLCINCFKESCGIKVYNDRN